MTIDEQRAQYLARVQAEIAAHGYQHVYIYGAAFGARQLYLLLRDHGITPLGFVVTHPDDNPASLFGLPVIGLDALSAPDGDTLFLLAVKILYEREIVAALDAHGYHHCIIVPGTAKAILHLSNYFERPALDIGTNIGCSVKCRYCPQDLLLSRYFADDPRRRAMLPLDDFKRYLDKTPADAMVVFAGFAEPFLNPAALDMMRYVAATNRQMILFTTMLGCSLEALRELERLPFSRVVLHLPDKDGFAKIPMDGDYFQKLDLILSMTKPNGSPFVDTANSQSEAHPAVQARIRGRVSVMRELHDRAGNLHNDSLMHQHGLKGALVCLPYPKQNHFVLLPDGHVVLCFNDYGLQHPVGDLNTQTWGEILDGEPMREIRRRMADDTRGPLLCRNCTVAAPL